ncbi:MAG: hypothetical protein IT223_07290, partial [Crocinitomicaceae bacterium]|nr:hypothetical protein [Crocinitomicaceae bacterium]
MKKIIFSITISLFVALSFYAQQSGVSINTSGSNPAPSAILDVSSTSQGVLIPRMTQSER